MKKFKEAILSAPITGVCDLDLPAIIKFFDHTCFITKYHNEYKLVRKTYKRNIALKITIKIADAKKIIKDKKLLEIKSDIFKHASWYGMENEENE